MGSRLVQVNDVSLPGGERAVYDYEDHDAARRFLSAGMQGEDLLRSDVVIDPAGRL